MEEAKSTYENNDGGTEEAFTVYELPQSTTLMLYLDRDKICANPPYQRDSDVWTPPKKQLLIDSILNGFDIPKLYFIESPNDRECRKYRFAVVDGKQRLNAIWDFMDDKYPLSDDFSYREDASIKAAGLTYSDLAKKYPRLKAKFDSHKLSVVVIKTNDVEILEEMFSRLNEGEPLTAAEKRNAMGGPIPPVVRELAKHAFFEDKVLFGDRRGRYREIATKFMFFEERGGISDTKRGYLDRFVQRWKEYAKKKETKEVEKEIKNIKNKVELNLEELNNIFNTKDELLKSIGMVILYYLLIRYAREIGAKVERYKLLEFNEARKLNREVAEKEYADAEWELLEFDRLSQSLNDASALRFRLNVLAKFVLGKEPDSKIVDPVKTGENGEF